VFDPASLERFLECVDGRDVPVVAGIWPLLDLRNAEFLANEVPGVAVPPVIVARMRKAQESGTEAALEEGVTIALEMIDAVRPMVRGFHISAPWGRVDVALRVLREGGVRATA
jgi:5,10-methylenetetrahydrofolate reductase